MGIPVDVWYISKRDLHELNNLVDRLNRTHQSNEEDAANEVFPRKLMTVEELCRYTTYKRPTIYRFVAEDKIPYLKTKGRLFFDKDKIDEWLNRNKNKDKD